MLSKGRLPATTVCLKFNSMKNLIYLTTIITLLVSCKPKESEKDTDTHTHSRGPGPNGRGHKWARAIRTVLWAQRALKQTETYLNLSG